MRGGSDEQNGWRQPKRAQMMPDASFGPLVSFFSFHVLLTLTIIFRYHDEDGARNADVYRAHIFFTFLKNLLVNYAYGMGNNDVHPPPPSPHFVW